MPLRTALIFCLVGAAAAASAGAQAAQMQTVPPVSGSSQTGSVTAATRVHGTVTDPDGELIPGAAITFTPAKGAPVRIKSGSDGTYSGNVAPGTYTMLVTMQGFQSYSASGVRIGAGAGVTLDAKLLIGEQSIVVNVDATGMQLSLDPEDNASSTVLKGDDLNALSDDPDELQSELQALAGPAAGPNGGQIYVDGFTGGQLPPKSSIREIRINQNPFSAQYDRIGFGRVEVFTKPGTDKLHGNLQVNGNPSQFDSGLPPNTNGAVQPGYHTIFMFGSVTGPINKNMSYNLGGSHRDIEQNAYTYTPQIYATGPNATTICAPGQAGCSIFNGDQAAHIFTYQPRVRTDINPRLDIALGSKNVLTVRYQFVRNDETNNGVGNLTLPSAGSNSSSTSNTLQLSDTQTLSSRLINETRFEYERERSNTVALSNAPSINVSGAFNGGGSSAQNASDHSDHIEVQNYTSFQMKRNFLRFGGRLRTTREAEFTSAGTNGSFTYAGLVNNCAPVNGVYAPGCSASTPDYSYATGQARQFSITRVNVPAFRYTFADLGLYAETDWKPISNLTISYGIRYETQNHLPDHHDIAPRVSFAYGLGSKKGSPLVVIRGGFGIFYDRYSGNYILNTIRENGSNETIFTTSNTSLLPASCAPFSTGYTFSSCTANLSAAQTQIYTRTKNLRTPYNEQLALGIDKGLGRIGTMSVNYIHTLGVHQLATQNVGYNAAVPVNSSAFYQYFSEGQFRQNQLIVNGRVQTTKWLSLGGFYSLGFAVGNTTGNGAFISQPGNIQADFGRTGFDRRSFGLIFGSVTLPHFMQFSPFLQAQSGSPYNITSGNDDNTDTVFNDRPYLLNGANPAAGALTKSIAGCGTFTSIAPVAGAARTPINYCTGPAQFAFNVRFTKTWGFGEMRNANRNGGQGGGGRGQGGGGGFGMGGGPPGGGGGGRGGGPGGGGGGGMNTGHRYNFGVGVQAQNIFGNRDLATPIGTLTSANFGQSTQLAGNPYTTTNAVRRFSLQASFSF